MPDSRERSDRGPQEAHVRGYQPHHNQRRPNGLITITGSFEDDRRDGPRPGEYESDWKGRLESKFGGEAQAILDVLANNLPGGTMRQLLIKMLQREVNLFVVQDVPAVTISELARDFVWSADNWESYQDRKTSISVSTPPEWLHLCEAVEKRYGSPPVEAALDAEWPVPTTEVTALMAAYERGDVLQVGAQKISAVTIASEPGYVRVQFEGDDAEWFLTHPRVITTFPF